MPIPLPAPHAPRPPGWPGRRVGLLTVGAVLAGVLLVGVVFATSAAAQPAQPAEPDPSSPDPCLAPDGPLEDCLFPLLPPQTPIPTPTPIPTVPEVPVASDDDGGPGGVVGWIVDGITHAIDSFFRGLVTDALNPLLDLLGHTLLATPSVGSLPQVAELWEASRVFAVAAYVLLVMIAGMVLMAHETVQTRYSVKEIAPRIVVGFLAVNLSLMLADQAIGFANAASQAVLGDGVDPQEAADTLTTLVMGALNSQGIFVIFIGLALAVALVALLMTYVVRVALTVILIAGAPLALACHGLPQTEGVARWWWRAFFGVLAIQLGQSLALVVALNVFFAPGGFTVFGPTTDGLVNLIVTLALFYILVKIPFWILQQVQVGSGRSFVGGLVKGFIAYKTLGLLGGRGGHHRPPRSGPSQLAGGGRSGGGPRPRLGGPGSPPPAARPPAPHPVGPGGPGGPAPTPAAVRTRADHPAATAGGRLSVTSRRQQVARDAHRSADGGRRVPGGQPPPVRAHPRLGHSHDPRPPAPLAGRHDHHPLRQQSAVPARAHPPATTPGTGPPHPAVPRNELPRQATRPVTLATAAASTPPGGLGWSAPSGQPVQPLSPRRAPRPDPRSRTSRRGGETP